jgi:hypothetical protein
VIAIAEDTGKISLSMKYVSQTTGEDQDVNNVDISMAQQKEKHLREENKPLELGAVLNTTCSKCGAKGHMASECYSTDGTKYEFLKDEEPVPTPM